MSKNTQKLLKLIDLVSQQIQERVCDMGEMADKITLSQIKLLKLVSISDELSMADIAKRLKITPASTTSLVDKLVQQDWLIRKPDESDRRKIYIEMSPKKKEAWQKMHTKEMERLGEYMNVLSEEQQKQFITILESLANQST